MNATIEAPKLAPPGTGLPYPELLVARLLFKFRRWRGNRDSFTEHFQRERAAIRTLVQSCDAEAVARRVLIPRLRGLEDSSRNWSVWMTLDHLRIVNHGILRTIESLTKGVVPPGKASTAAVKPSPEVDATILSKYEKSCDLLLGTVGNVPNLKTSVRYPHPWFGPLDASGWHALAAGHMSVHRAQIEHILNRQPTRQISLSMNLTP
jgi:uncharacterized damage-inducible protein DinB